MSEEVRRINLLQRQIDDLIRSEVGRWVDISASVSVYQAAAIAATVNEARVFIEKNKVNVICHFSITAAGTANNPIYVLLPATLAPAYSSGQLGFPLGTYSYHDTGTGIYHAQADYATTITGLPAIGGWAHLAGNRIGQTPNIATANGDNIGINIIYRIN